MLPALQFPKLELIPPKLELIPPKLELIALYH